MEAVEILEVGVRQCPMIDRHGVATVDSLTGRTERQPKCKRPIKRRKQLRVLVRSWISCPPLLFCCFFYLFSQGGIKDQYNRVDRNSRAYYNTNFHHLRVHRQSIGIAAVLRAELRRTIQCIRSSAILLANYAGCVRAVRERQVLSDGRRES